MNKFSGLKYIDAKYAYQQLGLSDLHLDKHQAYGSFFTNAEGDYIVSYVLSNNPNFKNKIMEGLILPKGSLLSEHKNKS